MKQKIRIIVCCLAAIVLSMTAPLLVKGQTSTERYHQHISAKLRPEDEVEDGTFNTHLPLILIDTDGRDIPGDIQKDPNRPGKNLADENGHAVYTTAEDGGPTIRAGIRIVDHEAVVNRPEDAATVETAADLRVRGASSRHFDKKGYLLKLVSDDGTNNPLPLLGMDAHHEWALHGPILDKTLIRNYMWYNISGEIMDYAPNVRFCEVMINGEYQGLYVLTEMITAGDGGARLQLSVNKKHDTFSGYLLRLDRGTNEPLKDVPSFLRYSRRSSGQLEIKYPGLEKLTPESAQGIQREFSEFEKALYSYDYDNEKYGYRKYVDTANFVDYMLINEFTCNYDAGRYSTYMYKGIDGRYRMVVWDFNNACDNYQEAETFRFGFRFPNAVWYSMMARDEYFTEMAVERYRYLRSTYLSEAYLEQYIDDTLAYLGPAIDRNFEVWGYTFVEQHNALLPKDRNPLSFEEAVSDLKTFLHERGDWMDENIDVLLQYSNESKVKKFNAFAN